MLQATKGKQRLAFFTMPEYEAWKETAPPGWTIKYYKGLGTSDKKEAQEYFAAIDLHRKTFVHQGGKLHLPLNSSMPRLGSRRHAAVWGCMVPERALRLAQLWGFRNPGRRSDKHQ